MENLYTISTLEQLSSLYDEAGEASIKKEVNYLHPHYQAIIKASPFLVLATCGKDGLDASPRGDTPGFVEILDEKTLVLPDRRGNNRIDSLRNILFNPKIALLFFVPGLGETLRVNGMGSISTDPALLARHAVAGKTPKTVLIINVQSVFFQCSRAIRRSHLWGPIENENKLLPTPGKVLSALTNSEIDGDKYDHELPGRIEKTLY